MKTPDDENLRRKSSEDTLGDASRDGDGQDAFEFDLDSIFGNRDAAASPEDSGVYCDPSYEDSESEFPDLDEDGSRDLDDLDLKIREEPEQAYFQLQGLEDQAFSNSVGKSLVIGSHPHCSVRISDPTVAPFHCFLAWLSDGMHLFDLGSYRGTLLQKRAVRQVKLSDGQQVGIGNKTYTAALHGDPQHPAKQREEKRYKVLAITVIFGPHTGETATLPAKRVLSLGRHPSCDLQFPQDRMISRRHAELEVKIDKDEPTLLVRHVGQRNPTLINGKPVEGEARARVGDVIHFANKQSVTALLVHYGLHYDEW